MSREAMKHKLEFMREMNDKRHKPLKTTSELAKEGGCCSSCTHYKQPTSWLIPFCKLKGKEVKSYNICESWKP